MNPLEGPITDSPVQDVAANYRLQKFCRAGTWLSLPRRLKDLRQAASGFVDSRSLTPASKNSIRVRAYWLQLDQCCVDGRRLGNGTG